MGVFWLVQSKLAAFSTTAIIVNVVGEHNVIVYPGKQHEQHADQTTSLFTAPGCYGDLLSNAAGRRERIPVGCV